MNPYISYVKGKNNNYILYKKAMDVQNKQTKLNWNSDRKLL